jgi:hypothetical protein
MTFAAFNYLFGTDIKEINIENRKSIKFHTNIYVKICHLLVLHFSRLKKPFASGLSGLRLLILAEKKITESSTALASPFCVLVIFNENVQFLEETEGFRYILLAALPAFPLPPLLLRFVIAAKSDRVWSTQHLMIPASVPSQSGALPQSQSPPSSTACSWISGTFPNPCTA